MLSTENSLISSSLKVFRLCAFVAVVNNDCITYFYLGIQTHLKLEMKSLCRFLMVTRSNVKPELTFKKTVIGI